LGVVTQKKEVVQENREKRVVEAKKARWRRGKKHF